MVERAWAGPQGTPKCSLKLPGRKRLRRASGVRFPFRRFAVSPFRRFATLGLAFATVSDTAARAFSIIVSVLSTLSTYALS
jgi:hypothetical protein